MDSGELDIQRGELTDSSSAGIEKAFGISNEAHKRGGGGVSVSLQSYQDQFKVIR